jgi:gas vesicle protein
MKNLFKKKDNSGLIAAMVIGSIAAGITAYLYLTESGAELRGDLKKKLKEKGKDMAAGAVSKKTGFSKKAVKKVADAIV